METIETRDTQNHKDYFVSLLGKLGVKQEPTPELLDKVQKCGTRAEVRGLALAFEQELEVVPLTEEQKESLSGIAHKFLPQRAALETNIRDYTTRAQQHQREALSYLSHLYKVSRKLDELDNKKVDVPAMVNKVCASGFYTFLKVEGDTLHFRTKPITLTHGDMAVDMGRYLLSFNVVDGRVLVNVEGRSLIEGYPHPHVSGYEMCLGTAADTVRKAAKELDLPLLFECYQALLTSYNDESPYRSLWQFHVEKNWEQVLAEGNLTGELESTWTILTMYVPKETHRAALRYYGEMATTSGLQQAAVSVGLYTVASKNYGGRRLPGKYFKLRGGKWARATPHTNCNVEDRHTEYVYQSPLNGEQAQDWINNG